MLEQHEREKQSKPEHELSKWGQVHIVEGDFFKDDWCKKESIQSEGGFDLIYDYTVGLISQSCVLFSFMN